MSDLSKEISGYMQPAIKDKPILSEAPKIFNGYIKDASLGIGYGADSGSCQLTIFYEKDGPLRDTFDPEANFPALGTAVGFRFGECTFGGIFQRYTNKRSTSGYTWDLIIESPGKWLEGIQIILDIFQGNRFTIGQGALDDRTKPSDDSRKSGIINTEANGVFTNQLNNIWNPYACREYFGYVASDGYAGLFGQSLVNSAGFPALDALDLIQRISQGKEKFGGKAVFGDSQYEVDLTEVIRITPSYFRLKGPVQSLSSIIQECCEVALHDYIVFIEPKSGEILSNGIIDDPVIKVKVIDKSSPPDPNTIKNFINYYEKSNQLISGDFGKEFNDTVTQRLVIGGPASRYNFVNGAECRPVWGKLSLSGGQTSLGSNVVYDMARSTPANAGYTVGGGTGYNQAAPIVLKNVNAVYQATVLEIRCAMASFETWMLYKLLTDNKFPGISNVRLDATTLKRLASGNITINELLDSSIAKQKFLAGMHSGQNIFEQLNSLHAEIKNAGEEFYGRKFLVPLPIEGLFIPNNIKWIQEDQTYISSWNVSQSAWSETKPFFDVSFYDSEGKLTTTASWMINPTYDYSSLSDSYAFDYLTGGIGTNKVDYVCEDVIFYTSAEIPLAAFVVVDVPPVSYFDQYTTDSYGLYHLLKLIKNINVHPNVMRSFGAENGPLSHAIAPARVAPIQFGIPQESTRYSWGPWWWASSKKGKAEVVVETELRPETFGSGAVADQVGFSYAYMSNANVGGNESGYVELPEIPAYNLATRFAGTGPYITNIDIVMGLDGVKTTYKFNTWTPQFGKLAKYNADRIARINKNYIRFLQEQRKKISNPPLPAKQVPSILGTPNMAVKMFGMRAMNMTLGQLLKGSDNILRPNIHSGNTENALASMPADMNSAAGCSQEQIMTPVMTHQKLPTQSSNNIPSFVSPQTSKAPPTKAKFENKHVGPTSKELNPYYGQPKNDFQQAIFDSSTNYNLQENTPDSVRTMAMRGPLMLSGWGYGLDDTPVPSSGTDTTAKRFAFNKEAGTNRSLWKTGPVHLMWDEERKVWAGGLQMIEGILISNITKATNPATGSTQFKIKVYRTEDWLHNEEEIVCINRDPSLEVKLTAQTIDKILVIAVRINYEWRPIWIGCPESM